MLKSVKALGSMKWNVFSLAPSARCIITSVKLQSTMARIGTYYHSGNLIYPQQSCHQLIVAFFISFFLLLLVCCSCHPRFTATAVPDTVAPSVTLQSPLHHCAYFVVVALTVTPIWLLVSKKVLFHSCGHLCSL